MSGSPQAQIIANGNTVAITLTTSAAIYTAVTTSASYPSDPAGIGMSSTGTVDDTFLYDCGMIIAYSVPVLNSFTFRPRSLRPALFRPGNSR